MKKSKAGEGDRVITRGEGRKLTKEDTWADTSVQEESHGSVPDRSSSKCKYPGGGSVSEEDSGRRWVQEVARALTM